MARRPRAVCKPHREGWADWYLGLERAWATAVGSDAAWEAGDRLVLASKLIVEEAKGRDYPRVGEWGDGRRCYYCALRLDGVRHEEAVARAAEFKPGGVVRDEA
jgi:hypothetical protein